MVLVVTVQSMECAYKNANIICMLVICGIWILLINIGLMLHYLESKSILQISTVVETQSGAEIKRHTW